MAAMSLKLFILLTLLGNTVSRNYSCDQRSIIQLLKRPIYDFSTGILDRVAQNEDGHFVFSPLSTWLQLSALAQGASGDTLREIRRVTRHHRNDCFKLKLAHTLRKMYRSNNEFIRKSVIVIDGLLDVKPNFIHKVKRFYDIKVLLKSFNYQEASAREVNKYIEIDSEAVPKLVSGDDFNQTVMVISDNTVFYSAWQNPFNPAYTKSENFYKTADGADIAIGKVNMMSQTGYFNVAEMPLLEAKAVEIPCSNGFSMLLFLPTRNIWVGEIFYNLQRLTLNAIYHDLHAQGPKLINLKLPRFTVNTLVDNLPELIADMGLRKVFDPRRSELDKISDYTMYASVMKQMAYIDVTEQGVKAGAIAENLAKEDDYATEDFVANRPFAFMIVDKKTQFIPFAGAYSSPSEI